MLRLRRGAADAGGARAPAAEPHPEAARRAALAQQDAEVALVRTRPPYPTLPCFASSFGRAHARDGALDTTPASANSWAGCSNDSSCPPEAAAEADDVIVQASVFKTWGARMLRSTLHVVLPQAAPRGAGPPVRARGAPRGARRRSRSGARSTRRSAAPCGARWRRGPRRRWRPRQPPRGGTWSPCSP
jgi:hypothetical protein